MQGSPLSHTPTPPWPPCIHIHTGWRDRSPWGPAPRKALCLQPQPTATLPGAHSVPSSGGPFLVLQKYGLSGWLHHSCLQASKVLNCAARGTGSPGWTGPPALASCPGEPTVTERGQGVDGRGGHTAREAGGAHPTRAPHVRQLNSTPSASGLQQPHREEGTSPSPHASALPSKTSLLASKRPVCHRAGTRV